MQIIKSGLIRKVGILALALIIVVFGTSVIDKNFHFFSKISQLPGQVAGVIIVNDPGKFLPTVNLVGAQASAPYQDVQGNVAISGKVSVGDTTDNVGVTGITLGLGRSEIEFIASNYGDYGYGHKLYSYDPADGSGIVQLRLAARQGTTTWNENNMVVFASDGRVAIGQNWRPGAPLQVTGTSNEFTGSRNAIAMYNPNPSNSSSEILFMGKGAVRGWEVGNDILANGGNNFYIADATVGKGRLFIDEYGNSRFSGHLRLGDTSGSTQTAGPGNTLYFSGGPFASDNTDPISIGRYDYGYDVSALRVNLQDDNNDVFEVGSWGRCCDLSDIAVLKVSTNGTVTITGAFQVDGTKNFEINHPTKPGYKLVHSTVEGPEAAVFYRGEGQLVNGKAGITLPDYFEALTRVENRTVLLTPKFDGDEPISNIAASAVKNGEFGVRSIDNLNPSQKFYWEVKAVRKDVPPLVVENPAQK